MPIRHKLSDCVDKHGVTPKMGDFIRFTLYDGVENVVAEVKPHEKFGFKPTLLPYLEFEVFDGKLAEDDIALEEVLELTINSITINSITINSITYKEG